MLNIVPKKITAQTIKVIIVPSTGAPQPGDTLKVAINVDMSEINELLGGFNATLTWSADTLHYLEHRGATTEGFTNPIVNEQKASEGRLTFGNFNTQGMGGIINILNVRYLLVSASEAILSLKLEFSEMVAAQTFVNLLPFIKIIVTDVDELHQVIRIPGEYQLWQNYPNPFNSRTNITFTLPQASNVNIAIYNILGKKLRTLVDAPKAPGRYRLSWQGTDENEINLSSGIYICRIIAGNFKAEKTMLYIK